jgi:hypothetical protein
MKSKKATTTATTTAGPPPAAKDDNCYGDVVGVRGMAQRDRRKQVGPIRF